MPLSRTLAAFLLASFAAVAQPPFRGAPNITASHIHLNSADLKAATTFWCDILGTSTYSKGPLSGVSAQGVTILFTAKAPAAPGAGSAIDHLAFKVPDLQPILDKLAKTPYKAFRSQPDADRIMIDGPDGVRVEVIEDSSAYNSLAFDHIHLRSTQPKEMQAWYVKNIGARQGNGENEDSILVPGMNILIAHADAAPPADARAIDHIGFEVKDIESFCKKLADSGVKIDVAPHAIAEIGASVAFLTDPWGTKIELVEHTSK